MGLSSLRPLIFLFPGLVRICFASGDPVSGFPNYQERSILVLTNACRMDPLGFRDKHVGNFNILNPAVYPKVAPVRWNLNLNQAARFHANEMATVSGCAFSHSSCDSTSFFDRVKSYYTASSWVGENIAAGYSDPLRTIQQWILDDIGNGPAGDNSGDDGHRKNIMHGVYRELGAGYASGSNRYTYFWVQDFGGGTSSEICPIVDGSHFFTETGKTTFLVSYYDASGKAPLEKNLLLDQNPHAVTLHLGTASQGTYAYSTARGSSCRTYVFQFKDGSGKIWTYPQNGRFLTTGEGGCTQEYAATAIPFLDRYEPRPLYIRYTDQPQPVLAFSVMRTAALIRISDLRGRTVFSAVSPAGADRIALPGNSIGPGLYFCTIGEQVVRFIRM